MKAAIVSFIIIFSLPAGSFSQSTSSFCKGKYYRGYLFDTSYFIFKSIKDQQNRISITCDDVEAAERILKKQLANTVSSFGKQSNGDPDIRNKLRNYTRQYFGFTNNKGERVIWINLFWDKRKNQTAKNKLINVNDGGSYYWNVEVNLNKEMLINLEINGNG